MLRRSLLDKFIGVALSLLYFTVLFTFTPELLLLTILTPFIAIATPLLLKYVRKRLYLKNIDNNLIELLSLLTSFESMGLHIQDLFKSINNGDIEISNPYKSVAKEYSIIEKIYGDPLVSLNYLWRRYRGTRLSKFLQGYIDILRTTGDTLGYVESFLQSELINLSNKLSSLLNVIENFFESYLIIILSIILLSGLPGIKVPYAFIYLVILGANIITYIISVGISKLMFFDEPLYFEVLSTLFMIIVTILPSILSVIDTLVVILVAMALMIVYSKISTSYRIVIENRLSDLIEDMYSEAQHGFTIENIFGRIKTTSIELNEFSKRIHKLLSLGYRGSYISSLLDISRLVKEVMKLVLIPIEYSREHHRHLGYIALFLRKINELRQTISSKAKILHIYTLLLPITVYILSYGLQSINSNYGVTPANEVLIKYVIASSIPAWIVASKITSGYSLSSYKNLIIVLENILLYIIIQVLL